MTAATLKPCPLCGDQHPELEEINPGQWAVACTFCSGIGPYPRLADQSVDEAVRQWNIREDPKPW
jgi:hypothetical protein